MSYCRWSTNDFQSDLYCYESDWGFVTHVGGNRVIWGDKLPAEVERPDFNLNRESLEYKEQSSKWFERRQKVMSLLEGIQREPIGLKYDGETFNDRTLPEFLETLQMLKDEGYIFPDYVFDIVKDELKEEQTCHVVNISSTVCKLDTRSCNDTHDRI